MNKLAFLKTMGIILIVISSTLWIGLVFVHFLPISAAGKVAVYTAILIIAEILFWLGAALAGSELLFKMRKIINPIYWFKRKNGINNNELTREGYIPVTGGKIWYRIVGADKKGIPLLVLHGGPGVPHDYLEPLEALSDERPVVFYDQLGCGNSDKPDSNSLWTTERFVNELARVRQILKLDKLHILGQSWGSMLAVEYILNKKPKLIMSLILSGPCLSASLWHRDQRLYLSELPEAIQNTIMESESTGNFNSEEYQNAMMCFYKLHVCRIEPWPECLNRSFNKLARNIYEYMWGPSEFTITGTLKNYERADRLKEITIPVLFTCGQYDEASPSATKYYHSKLPGSEIAIFEGASHDHHIEKTELYLEKVRNFLNRTEESYRK